MCPYAWDRFGGVQSHVRALSSALRTRGHEVTILAPHAGRKTSAETGVVLAGRAVPVPANGSVAPLSFGPAAAAAARAALDRLAPDVVHLHEPLVPSLSLLALRAARAPAVGTFHAAAEASLGYRAARPLLTGAAERLAVRTAVSDEARALVARYFPGEYLLTPNGVEVERFAAAEPLDLGPRPTVLFFGRIERRKGLEVLIEAIALLRDLDARLVVAGGGPAERACRALARRLRIEVRWLGPLAEHAVPRALRAAGVLCAPNLGGESFGIVLIEAMAAGAPLVCSDLSAFRTVTGDAALRVPPGDPRALSEALRAVLTDEGLAERLAGAGRKTAARFSWKTLSAGVEGVYERALAVA